MYSYYSIKIFHSYRPEHISPLDDIAFAMYQVFSHYFHPHFINNKPVTKFECRIPKRLILYVDLKSVNEMLLKVLALIKISPHQNCLNVSSLCVLVVCILIFFFRRWFYWSKKASSGYQWFTQGKFLLNQTFGHLLVYKYIHTYNLYNNVPFQLSP